MKKIKNQISKIKYLGIRFFIFYFLFFIFVNGCGYTTKGFFYKENSIFIRPIVNKISITSEDRRSSNYTTYPILLEKKLTNMVINKFNIEGHLKVVNDETSPNMLKLECAITNYQKEALRYTNADEVEEQRLRLAVTAKLFDSTGNIFKEKEVVGEASYYLSGPRQRSEASAQETLIDDTARRIMEMVTEEW